MIDRPINTIKTRFSDAIQIRTIQNENTLSINTNSLDATAKK
jgi:hypothetical protein